jgi:hypothetical protein
MGLTGSENWCNPLLFNKLGNCLECVGIISLLSGSSAGNGVEVQVLFRAITKCFSDKDLLTRL